MGEQLIQDYIDHGFKLIPIPHKSKAPLMKEWNKEGQHLKSVMDLPDGYGVGLAHAYSNTMALDIDDLESAILELEKCKIDLVELIKDESSVMVISGKKGRCKLLYTVEEPLPSCKININGHTVFELRCSTASGLTVQDVLPPSIHPETEKPYEWRGDWKNIPPIPEPLLIYWKSKLNYEKVSEPLKTEKVELPYTLKNIKSALDTLSSDTTRDEWIKVGMGLHYYGIQVDDMVSTFETWNRWSEKSISKYPGYKEIRDQWESFTSEKNTLITPKTIFQMALRNGWEGDNVNFYDLFKPENQKDLDLSSLLRMSPPKLDLKLWPQLLQGYVSEISERVGCDPLVPLWASLSTICAVVDARTKLELLPGFLVQPILWLMTIGEPGDKKTPGSRPVFEVLKKIEDGDRKDYAKRLLEWETLEAIYLNAKKNRLTQAANSTLSNEQYQDVPDLPPQPVPLRFMVNDITSQKLMRELADRPSGMMCYLDEMNSWVKKLTDRSSSEDRSNWVMAYDGGSHNVDRVGGGYIYIRNLALSIYGNIQPAVFRKALSMLSTDGLLQRFIPAVLNSKYTKKGTTIPEFLSKQKEWEELVKKVHALPIITYKLSKEAYEEFDKFQDWYEQKKCDERLLQSSDVFMTAFSKIEGTTGRFILLFHLIENPYSTTVEADIVKRVVTIVKTFIIPSIRYAFSEIGGVSTFQMWLNDFIINNSYKELIDSTLIRRRGWRLLEDINPAYVDKLIEDNMAMLESMGWVVKLEDGFSYKKVKSAQWAISPRLNQQYKEHTEKVLAARERQKEDLTSQ